MASTFLDRYEVGRVDVGRIAGYSKKADAFAHALRYGVGTEVFDICARRGARRLWVCEPDPQTGKPSMRPTVAPFDTRRM